MNAWRKLRSRFRALLRKEKIDAEMDEELRSHIELRTRANIEAGINPEEARFAALRQFGWTESIKEDCREQRGVRWLESLVQDIRYSARQLRKNPGFTTVAVLTLAFGIGANTVIFSLANLALFGSFPAEKPRELVSVFFGDSRGQGTSNHSYADYADYRRETGDVLAGIAAFTPVPAHLLVGQQTERISVGLVSDNYFSVLGIRPLIGRAFSPDENQTPGSHPVAMIGEGLWRRQFAGDRNVTGKTIWLNNAAYTVVGVLPESAARMVAVLKVEVFVPAMMQGVVAQSRDYLAERGNKEFMVVGRLQPGVTLAKAQSRFNVLATQLAKQYPESWLDRGSPRPLTVVAQSQSQLPFELRGYVVGFMALLLGVVGAVLLIACANIANFLLARATARRKEMAVRLALGASRRRIIRQLLTESLLLSIGGGAAGLLVAYWAADLLAAFVPNLGVPLALNLSMDSRVLAFNLAVTLGTTVTFGLAPALQASRPELVQGLREGEGALAPGWRRFSLRNVLVVGQVATSLVLLLCAGTFLRSLGKLHSIDLGFEPENVALLSVDLGLQGYAPEKSRVFYEQAMERLQRLPGVVAVAAARRVPLGASKVGRQFVPEGHEKSSFGFNLVGPHYFETMEIPIQGGRSFTAEDREGAPRTAIVNHVFAERFWPGQSPLGKRLFENGNSPLEIVGVCKASKYDSLSEGRVAFVYLPLLQNYKPSLTFHVRTRSAPATLLHNFQQELLALDPTLAVFDLKTMNEHLATSMLPIRVGATLLGIFGALALALATLGLYGVMSYAVTRRTREIGIRMALGARRNDVLRLIVRQGMKLTFAGVFVGLVLGSGLTAVIASQLFGVSAADVVTLTGMSLALTIVALLACWLPARRAARVDPMVALRHE
jgi:predicted permease